jgi:LysM repeat protein
MRIHRVNTPAARARRAGWIAAMLVGAFVVGPQAFADGPVEPVLADTYTVAPGETLWSIAQSVGEPGRDVYETLYVIQDLNGMTGSSLQAGQQILVPVRTP